MKKYLPFSRRQPSLDRFSVSRSGWAGSDRFGNGKSLRRTSAASLNTRSIQVVRGAYNIDLNKVDSSFTKLHRACLLNDDTQVKKHLLKVDNNSHDSSHRYPIHLATVNGNFAIIKLLIDNGANPNVQDNEGNTPLIKSIECGHEHLVKFFLSNGADPNISDMDNNSSLHWALMTESIIAIDALLSSKKCDLSLRNNKDETCLHLAVRCPLINTLTFESMIRSGSDLDAKDQLGLTVIDIAQACNNKVAINALDRCEKLDTRLKESASKLSENVVLKEDLDSNDNKENYDTVNAKKMCEEYKQKFIEKNRENLEYEKRVIQLAAQIERLKLDMSYIQKQNLKIEADYKRVMIENSTLKLDNKRLLEQVKSLKHRDELSEIGPVNGDETNPDGVKPDVNKEPIDCRGHKEFLAAKNTNQERINKLKSSLTT